MEKSITPKLTTNIFKMGKYTFQYPIDHSKKKPINKEAIKELKNVQSDTLDISWGKYKRFKWANVFKRLKQSQIQRIAAYGNGDPHILLTISKVNFYNLTFLDLGQCHIENIESLPSNANLNHLSLINNSIYTLKKLQKSQLSGLKTLLLNDNPIQNLNLQRCNFQLETFWLQRKYNFKTIKECLSQSCIFKIQAQYMKDISIESIGRIHKKNCIERIYAKYPKLQRLFYLEPDDLFNSDHQFVSYSSDEEEYMLAVENVAEDIQIHQPPALHFIEGQQEENWMEEQIHKEKQNANQAEQIYDNDEIKENQQKHEKHEEIENQSKSKEEQEDFCSNNSNNSNWDSSFD